MPGLILKLRAHEQILVNGVVMQNGERNTRLIIKTPDAKILRLRDAIHPDEVDTPVKRVCYVAQLAVAGEAEPDDAVRELDRGIQQLRDAFAGIPVGEALDGALAELRRRNFYGCLRRLRQLLAVEERLLANGSLDGEILEASAKDGARLSPADPSTSDAVPLTTSVRRGGCAAEPQPRSLSAAATDKAAR